MQWKNAKATSGTIMVIKLSATEQENFKFILDSNMWKIIYWRIKNWWRTQAILQYAWKSLMKLLFIKSRVSFDLYLNMQILSY